MDLTMNKLKIFLLLIICIASFQVKAQVYDDPIDSTAHYNLRLYAQSARIPASILNDDKIMIDSVLYSLIVWTDSVQYVVVLDTNISSTNLVLKLSNYATGSAVFTTTATTCTVSVAGADTLTEAGDIFMVTPYGTTNANDVLSYTVSDTDIIVSRPASGTSGLKFKWYWIKRY